MFSLIIGSQNVKSHLIFFCAHNIFEGTWINMSSISLLLTSFSVKSCHVWVSFDFFICCR